MSLRRFCRQTGKQPSKVLFFFPEENKTGIGPTRIIVEKDIVLNERLHVTVNWGGEIVGAEILALSGKLSILKLLRFISLVIVRRISLSSNLSVWTFLLYLPCTFFSRWWSCVTSERYRVLAEQKPTTCFRERRRECWDEGNSLPQSKKVLQRKVIIHGSF